jgi:hypothetical protein
MDLQVTPAGRSALGRGADAGAWAAALDGVYPLDVVFAAISVDAHAELHLDTSVWRSVAALVIDDAWARLWQAHPASVASVFDIGVRHGRHVGCLGIHGRIGHLGWYGAGATEKSQAEQKTHAHTVRAPSFIVEVNK